MDEVILSWFAADDLAAGSLQRAQQTVVGTTQLLAPLCSGFQLT
jgi:hypothetical protein